VSAQLAASQEGLSSMSEVGYSRYDVLSNMFQTTTTNMKDMPTNTEIRN
jgi:hypothetical protein